MPSRFVLGLALVLLAVWFWSGMGALDRTTWLLENVLVAAAVGVLVFSYQRFPLSKLSYFLIFVFLCLHLIGAHYTYSQTPYDAWSRNLFGFSVDGLLGWQRNNFDRVIHFAYGLLLVYPMREMFLRIADVRGFWGYFLPLDLTMSSSMIYELIEWGAAAVIGDGSTEFLGTQGDQWDAHKDMALATLGGFVGILLVLLVNLGSQRDFTREFIDSLAVKHTQPLGEVSLTDVGQQRL